MHLLVELIPLGNRKTAALIYITPFLNIRACFWSSQHYNVIFQEGTKEYAMLEM